MGRRLQFDTKGNEKQKEVARLLMTQSLTFCMLARKVLANPTSGVP